MRLSKRGFIIIASICLAVFAACLLIVLFADTARWGTAVFTGLSGAIGNGPGILLRLFTYLGSTEGVILICVVLLAIPKRFFRRQIAFPVVSTTVISWILNEGIKLAVRRARPGVEALITASGFSFPSGHAMNNAALYFSLFFMVLRYMEPGKGRNILAAVLCVIPAFIAFSRVYVGVHYTTDVIAGAALGFLLALIMNQISGREMETNDRAQSLQS